MAAYFNENDPFAAAWLRELIRADQIAPGDVDERSVKDVEAADLKGYAQCHFFAGIGVWSHALRAAGVADDRRLWTGSCPCQPFSDAGKAGGTGDERHLWPDWFRLIGQCRPAIVLGEQVASKAGLGWLDLVSDDMEGAGYAIGAADLCAAGIGAPHIRQRLWFVGLANTQGAGSSSQSQGKLRRQLPDGFGQRGQIDGLADADDARPQGWGVGGNGAGQRAAGAGGVAGGLADAATERPAWNTAGGRQAGAGVEHLCGNGRPGPADSFWSDADWLYCRDGKWRPVGPGTFPLATGLAGRVGRLRGYGNSIVSPVAKVFIETVMEIV